jgi:DNA-binding PucR family transcriptional regulator
MVRITALAEPPERGTAEYVQGLRSAVGAAVAYTIEGMVRGEHEGGPIPDPLLTQARRAASSGVGLDTVLRRYVAGHALLGDFLVEETGGRIEPAELKLLLRRLASTLDTLLAAVTAAYGLEERRHRRTAEQRRAELVERLLTGEPVDASELGYEFEQHHLGLVTCGAEAGEMLASLARTTDARLLAVRTEEEDTWAWLGTRARLDPAEVHRLAGKIRSRKLVLALGEPGESSSGWRLSHGQARAALRVARRGGEPCVRYADVAMLATVLQDDLLSTSLRRFYLEPLETERDGGQTLRETLRAYFVAEQNVSSAAASLGVDRRTVANRLRLIESQIGSSVGRCAGDLQMALDLAELD